MNKRWAPALLCASMSCVLAISCGGGSDSGGSAGGSSGASGSGGNSGRGGAGGTNQAAGSGNDAGTSANAGMAGQSVGAGDEGGNAGAGGNASAGGEGGNAGGEGGAAGAPADTSPLSPTDIPDLAFWLDGNATTFYDRDEDYPNPPDSGVVRSVSEAPPLQGIWQAPTSAECPTHELGAISMRPVGSPTGTYLKDSAGTIQTDDSTIALSIVPLNSNSAQGALQAQIGTSSQNVGIFFNGDSLGLYYNHTQVTLKKRISRGLHATIVVRFTPTLIDVQYDVNGLRTSETVDTTSAPIAHETASNFLLGYDSKLNSSIYGFVSQVVGVNRAISDAEASRMLTWMADQPIPAAFPTTQPLVAIVGDSIGNGDQVSGVQSWAFSMLGDLANTYPDVQLLNDSLNGSGVPLVKNSSYSDDILPWFSTSRAKNILVVAAATNDLAGSTAIEVQDVINRYEGLLDAARATGWKTVACTVLPRSEATLTPIFEASRTTFNNEIVAHYAAHADALADVASIPAMGASGDSNDPTYYSVDKIHPNAAGHALLEPVYRAAVAKLLQP